MRQQHESIDVAWLAVHNCVCGRESTHARADYGHHLRAGVARVASCGEHVQIHVVETGAGIWTSVRFAVPSKIDGDHTKAGASQLRCLYVPAALVKTNA